MKTVIVHFIKCGQRSPMNLATLTDHEIAVLIGTMMACQIGADIELLYEWGKQ